MNWLCLTKNLAAHENRKRSSDSQILMSFGCEPQMGCHRELWNNLYT
jgi:hypothetical protein